MRLCLDWPQAIRMVLISKQILRPRVGYSVFRISWRSLLDNLRFVTYIKNTWILTVADLGGGCIPPPTSLKVTILAEKLASISNNSAPFRDASPPTDLNVTNPAKNQSQFW